MTKHRHSASNLYDLLCEKQRDIGGTPCEAMPEVFYPEDYEDVEMHDMATDIAKKMCNECPLKDLCREWSIVAAVPYGIIGGLTPQERQITPETIS